MSIDQRDQMRKVFVDAWTKFKNQQSLSSLETQIIELIQQHPEYIDLFDNPEQHFQQNYSTDTNPFLHLSLHLSLREQIATHRPQGIQTIYQNLLNKYHNQQEVEHLMMDVLAHILWDAQKNGVLASEELYLERLRRLLVE